MKPCFPEITSALGLTVRCLSYTMVLLAVAKECTVLLTPDDARAGVATERYKQAEPGSTFSDCKDDCPVMVVIQAGKFLMGSTQYAREQPQHIVTFPAPFAVSKFDITFDEWASCAANGGCSGNKLPSDAGWGHGRRPVINVSWIDAHDYVSWLSKKTGKPYRLLTEAEWEYVARAGSATNYPWGDLIDCGKANYDGSPGSPCRDRTGRQRPRGTQPVGSYAPNAWGLYDTNGNAWQWCEDSWHPDYRGAPLDGTAWKGGDESMNVLRGGAWNYGPSGLRSADRNWLPRSARTSFLGFRVASPLETNIAINEPAAGDELNGDFSAETRWWSSTP